MTEIIKYLNHKVNGNTITYPIGTELKFIESKDNSLLIQTGKTTLDKILPLKVNQEEIINNNSNTITTFDSITKQGIYSIQKNLNNGPTNDNSNSSLIVLKVSSIIHQIFFKKNEVYSRYRYQENKENIWASWENNIGTNFSGSNSSEAGIRGLVPAPMETEIDNYFLNSNGRWTSLNNIAFNGIPTFNKGFTSKETISVKNSANTILASISNTGEGTFNNIDINSNASIGSDGKGSFNNIDINSNAFISNTGVGKFASINIKNSSGDTTVIDSSCNGKFADITGTGKGTFNSINIKNGDTNTAIIDNSCNGSFASITSGSIKIKKDNSETTVIDNSCNGSFASINIKQGDASKASINNEGDGSFNNIKINSNTVLDTSKNTGAATIVGGAYIGGAVKIGNTTDTVANNANTGALLVSGGAYVEGHIRVGTNGGVYGALWNDLADSIVVNKDAKIEAGYCYCLKDNKYIKSSKYLDNGIIGIHSDTYGFKMGEKAGEKQLDCAVAGFVLAYVDKDYLPGTALTCTKDGRLTKMKSKDKQRFPEKIVATYWKDEPAEEWGSDNRKVKVNGRKWVKIK